MYIFSEYPIHYISTDETQIVSLAHERFLHFYGEPAVRLCRGLSVYGTIHRRTLLIRLLSPLLFATPLQHLMALEKIWVDGVVHEPTWKMFINKFNKRWEEAILFVSSVS